MKENFSKDDLETHSKSNQIKLMDDLEKHNKIIFEL